MGLRRFFCPDIPGTGVSFDLPEDEARHALKVLRVQPGEHIGLLDGRGTLAEAIITEADRSRRHAPVTCEVVESATFRRPRLGLSLFVAVPRGKLMGQVIRDATELGVQRVIPIICDFGVAKPGASPVAHWMAEAIAAIKQSGNVFLPEILPPCSLADAIAEAPPRNYVGAVPGDAVATADTPDIGAGELGVWIGPEGGFSESEMDLLFGSGFTPLTVGAWTLTLVTAVPALIGALLGRIDDDLLCCERC